MYFSLLLLLLQTLDAFDATVRRPLEQRAGELGSSHSLPFQARSSDTPLTSLGLFPYQCNEGGIKVISNIPSRSKTV